METRIKKIHENKSPIRKIDKWKATKKNEQKKIIQKLLTCKGATYKKHTTPSVTLTEILNKLISYDFIY